MPRFNPQPCCALRGLHPFFILLIALLFSLPSRSQHDPCGTELTAADLPFHRQMNQTIRNADPADLRNPNGNITLVPVQLHIVRASDGTGGIAATDFEAALERVNDYYAPAGMHFYQCAAINYIDDDNYYDYDKSEMGALDDAHSVMNVVNIYSTENVTSGTDGNGDPINICGHAQFPGGRDFLINANSCTLNGSTFEHELGHYFGLYHTHETFFGDELVNGTNCLVAGDQVCDTPADPRLGSSNVDRDVDCGYTGSDTDATGAAYVPLPTNMMSYSPKECRTELTDGQRSRMLTVFTTQRAYLTCGNVPTLAADFYYQPATTCGSNLTLDFWDVSEGNTTTWTWNFGDGNTATGRKVNHGYTTPGVYNVSLTVGNGSTTDTRTKNYAVVVGAVTVPFSTGFENGEADLGRFFRTVSMKNALVLDADAARTGSQGVNMQGFQNSTSPFYRTPASATASFTPGLNEFYRTEMSLCVDATAWADLTLNFDLKQLQRFNNNYTNLRVLANGATLATYQTDGSETWDQKTVDLTAYAGQVFTLTFEGSHKYEANYQSAANGNASFIDNIALTASTALPVEWQSFTGKHVPKTGNRLDWTTAQEVQSDYFAVQHSADGRSFATIGRVKSTGFSSVEQHYDFLHDNPQPGVNYYRLGETGTDGEVDYSEVIAVRTPLGERGFVAFPNPVDDRLQLRFAGEGLRVRAFNAVGKMIFERDWIAGGGAVSLDVSDWTPGTYLLEWQTAADKGVERIVVR